MAKKNSFFFILHVVFNIVLYKIQISLLYFFFFFLVSWSNEQMVESMQTNCFANKNIQFYWLWIKIDNNKK